MFKSYFSYIHVFLVFLQTTCFGIYYSQSGQDKFVNESFFKNIRSGIFIDIGAHSGIEISNTYFFETELGWSGICIEPIPELFDELTSNRKCVCVQGCITDHAGTAEFIRFPGNRAWFSGLKEKYNPLLLKNLEEAYGFNEYELINVDCITLNDLLEQHGIQHVNFLSIDTEGGEFDILSSLNFEKFQIDVITVENNLGDNRFAELMNKKGFRFVKKLDQDLIFVHKDFK
ncbi:MAG: hypothetical protein KR126chlam3_01231 [Chlamydiae bacterium]|nr:hypothetical protein [Chlamydiota bacterium]